MIGTQVGSWVIESHLGKGGMGQVYLARHKSLDTLAAVKVLAPTLEEEDFRKRFFQEAKTQARLRHPNIAQVLDYVEQDGKWFLVVEYMQQGSLADHLQTLTQPLPAHGAINYSRQALAGLGHAHEHGVVHRDVKPANLLLNERNEVAVTDFGIAMVEGEHRLTGTGLSVGTPRYMSPEQIMDPKGVDHRCDIYSMGIVLYQLLLGRVPFESDSSFEIQRAQVYETPPPMRQIDPRIPPELERIVLRALAKKPEERYATCTEFAAALTSWFQSAQPLTAPAIHHDATLLAPGEAPTQAAAALAPTARPAAPPVPPTVRLSDVPPTVREAPRSVPSPTSAAPAPAPAAARPASSSKVPLVLGVLVVLLLLGGAAAFFLLRGVLPGLREAVTRRETGEREALAQLAPDAAGPLASSPAGGGEAAAAGSGGPAGSSASGGAPAAPDSPAPAAPPPSEAAAAGPAALAPAPAASVPIRALEAPAAPTSLPGSAAPTVVTPVREAPRAPAPLRETPRILVVGTGETALAAAAQDALVDGLGGVGEVLTGRSVPRLADLLRGGGSPGVTELLRLARGADIDVLVLADAQFQGDEVRSTPASSFVALTSRLELSAYVVPSGDGLGPGWSTTVRYASASAATYGARAVVPLVPEVADAVARGWVRYRASEG